MPFVMKLTLDVHPRFVSKRRKYIPPNKMRLSFPLVVAAVIIGLASTVMAISEEENSAIFKKGVDLSLHSLNLSASRKSKKSKKSKEDKTTETCITKSIYDEAQALIMKFDSNPMKGDVGDGFWCGWAITKGSAVCGSGVVGCFLDCIASGGLLCLDYQFGVVSAACLAAIEEIFDEC